MVARRAPAGCPWKGGPRPAGRERAAGYYRRMPAWIDISLPIGPSAIAWSGLPPSRLSLLAAIADGDAVTVGQLDCCTHTGTHADAPWHVDLGGKTIDRMDAGLYVGQATVLRLASPQAIDRAELEELLGGDVKRGDPRVERLLIATPRPYDGKHFPARVPALAPEAADWLAWAGTRLVGVDQPSLDPLEAKDLASHRLLFAAGAGVLENLDLSRVEAGSYDLIAPPLRLIGGDAAPVRALVRRR